jgi:O-antigen ligase
MSATVPNAAQVSSLGISGSDRHSSAAARIAQAALLVFLAIVYSGGERYFYLISRPLQYGFDLLIIACIVLIVSATGIRASDALYALPYLAFVVAYTVWGLLVSPIQSLLVSAAVSAAGLNVLLFGGVFVALRDRRSLATLAYLILLAALVNVALVVWEAVDYTVTRSLANFAHTSYYVLERPGGLWVQPNDAAIALLFAALLSFWARGPRAVIWLARVGSAVAIFLTASRTGMYPLIFCAGIFGAMAVISSRSDGRLWIAVAGLGGAAVIVVGALIVFVEGQAIGTWLSTNYDLTRFLDLGQSLRLASDPSRTAAAQIWFAKALDGPWGGSGIYSFQGSLSLEGAHDMYIMVWGETGVVSLVLYLVVLTVGVLQAFSGAIPIRDRVALLTVWTVYLAVGLTTHTQFSSVAGIIVIALLYRLPEVLRDRFSEPRIEQTLERPRFG